MWLPPQLWPKATLTLLGLYFYWGFQLCCCALLQGARNQLRPAARAEWLAGARRPRVDVGQICSDEDDDMLIA